MNLYIKQSAYLNGAIVPPGSKSQTIRALCIATLARGKSVIHNALNSDDTRACIAVCKNFGARVSESVLGKEFTITIQSSGTPLNPLTKKFTSRNSGITTRFLIPMLGLANQSRAPFVLDCDSQMRARPIKSLVDALGSLGMKIRANSQECYWPLEVCGELKGGDASVSGATSQFFSALLLSLPCAQKNSRVTVHGLNERPYAQMTAQWLNEQKIKYEWHTSGTKDIIAIQGGKRYAPFIKSIAADFSSISYFIAAGILTQSEIQIANINMDDAQGDKKLIQILQRMGADISIQDSTLIILGGKELEGMEIDCNDIPDMVPTLAVIGTQARGATRLYNVAHARLKETDRIRSMACELSRLGANIQELPDGMIITRSKLNGSTVYGHDDHRTIMALAVAGLIARGQTIIKNAEGITKTFPEFVKTMQSIGASIRQTYGHHIVCSP